MDFFEVLILIFIVIPILEVVFKKHRKGKEAPQEAPAPRHRERVGAGAGAGEASSRPAPGGEDSAADMIPPDFWEVLTGERPREAPPAGSGWEPEGWEAPPDATVEAPPELGPAESWAPAHWEVDDEEGAGTRAERDAPASLEHIGPEAISLEIPPPPPEVRRRLHHEKHDIAPALEAGGESAHALRAALRGPELRRAIVLAEILGPPKGLA
ncbi:MAG TPA: hypothetical protein VMM12_00980 [Longimicrobiales bacterium]|nr:hypothetical protein [Longimicrobiales bacterium]